MGKYIVVIDDELVVGDLLSSMLNMLGYNSVTFCDGSEAMNKYRVDYTNVIMVITDLSMEGMTGVDVVKEILTINPEESIMVLTGFIKDNIMHFVDYDGVEIMHKPFTIQEMRSRLVSMIDKKEAKHKSV